MMLQLCSTDLSLIKRFVTFEHPYEMIMDLERIQPHKALICDASTACRLLELQASLKIIVLSSQPSIEEGLQLLRKGILGYSNTYVHVPILLQAVHAVENGKMWLYPALKKALMTKDSTFGVS